MNFKPWGYMVLALLFSLQVSGQETTTATTETTTTIEDAAQTEEAKQAEATVPASSGDRVEKLEVTGSRIKRINVEGPSPVLTLDREYLDRSGYNSVADVLRDSTVTATGVGREAAGGGSEGSGGSSGAATTGLRGFGPDKILVLLNGKRLPKIGGENAVDLNLIPFQAIERVDILKDGASAIYGSDALAGVINFITKKDYDGATVMMRYSTPEEVGGGQRQDISAIYGKNFNRGNFMAIYQYRSNKELKDSQREWSRNGLSPHGSPGSFRPVNAGGKWQPAANCPAERQVDFGDGNFYCSFDYTPYSWTLPAIEQHSAALTGEYELNESLKLYSNLIYTNRMSRWQYAPAPDVLANDTATGGGNFEIPNSIATGAGWGLPVGGDNAEVSYRFVNELGPRSNRDTTNSYGGTVGTKGYIGDSWEWDFSITHGESKVFNDGFSGYADKDVIFSLIQSGDFRPFDATGTGDVSSARTAAKQWIDSSLSQAQIMATGELGTFMGGVLSSAVGLSATWESFEETVDVVTARGSLFGGSGANGQGNRNFQSVFAELGLSFQKLEMQLAGRFDQFSDFGTTVNPKFAIRYLPWKELMFRGSIGTGFKAPTLNELYASQGYGYPWFTDQVQCNAAASSTDPVCSDQQYRTLTGGNTNLKEETSFSYNIGSMFQPSDNFNLSVDYWYTEINDAIGLDLNDLILAEIALGNANLPQYGVRVNRTGGATGSITSVEAPNLNLAQQKADGLEVGMDWMLRIGGVTINPHMDHTHMLSYLEEPFPGLGLISKLGEAGRPRWRNTSYVTVGFLKDHSIRLTARTIAGQFKQAHTANRADQRRTPNYTEYDINYRYTAFWDGQISFGVKNLMGTDRPLDTTAGFSNRLNTFLYDQLGRLYYLGYTQNF